MGEAFAIGTATALGFLIIMFKIGIHRFYRFEVFWDLAATISMMVLFMGTYAGMTAAIIGGIMFSIVLGVARRWADVQCQLDQ